MKIPSLKRRNHFKHYDSKLDLTGVKLIIKDEKGKTKVNQVIMDCKSNGGGLVVYSTKDKVYCIDPCSSRAKVVCDGRIFDGYIRSKIKENTLIIECIDIMPRDGIEKHTTYLEDWTMKKNRKNEYFSYRVAIDEYTLEDYKSVIE